MRIEKGGGNLRGQLKWPGLFQGTFISRHCDNSRINIHLEQGGSKCFMKILAYEVTLALKWISINNKLPIRL
jgi:hypothetical protein